MIPCAKFRGCLLAALAGDCLGAQFEFSPRRSSFRTVWLAFDANMRERRRCRRWPLVYTDDTALTRAVCESLVDCRGRVEPASLARSLTDAYFKATDRGYGAAAGGVFKDLRDANFADPFGPAAALFEGRGSYGNGGAMRAAPLGLIGAAAAAAPNAEEVHLATRVTHSNALALAGARLMAGPCDWRCASTASTWTAEAAAADTACGLHEGEASSYTSAMRQVKEFLGKHPASSAVDEEARAVAGALGTEVTALRSVPTAIYCALRTLRPSHRVHPLISEWQPPGNQNPSIDEALSIEQRQQQQRLLDCLTFAVSLGGDTDTIASMAGAIVGAALGADALPASLMLACEASDAVDSLATRLHRVAYSS
uniref:ADP-ribosylhydrolase ARH3 n=1 Tax=Macrostomum lignano TaxID=282301 RepID=A0A1I8IJ98_9PLAT